MSSDERLMVQSQATLSSPTYPPQLRPSRNISFYSDTQGPNFFLTLCLLVLLGLRPKRLQQQLDSDDPKTWENFREGLIRRWGTLGITSGLVLSAATTMLFSDRVEGAALVAAFASLCATIVSITFGTALAFIFADAPAKDFKVCKADPLIISAELTLRIGPGCSSATYGLSFVYSQHVCDGVNGGIIHIHYHLCVVFQRWESSYDTSKDGDYCRSINHGYTICVRDLVGAGSIWEG